MRGTVAGASRGITADLSRGVGLAGARRYISWRWGPVPALNGVGKSANIFELNEITNFISGRTAGPFLRAVKNHSDRGQADIASLLKDSELTLIRVIAVVWRLESAASPLIPMGSAQGAQP